MSYEGEPIVERKNLEGKLVSEVTFRTRDDDGWKDVTAKELFDEKKVVVFALHVRARRPQRTGV